MGYNGKPGSSGAGHGGGGGRGFGQPLTGHPHGSYAAPTSFGDDGGRSAFPFAGGRGAGRLRLLVADRLTIDGTLSANGGAWRSSGAGGGSGGSVFVRTLYVDGSGVVEAAGGAGCSPQSLPHGGGGAGGRIALYYVHNFFVGE